MKTKRFLSLLLSVVLLFSSLFVVFRSTSSAVAADEPEGQVELIDAVFVGKSGYDNPRIANIFFPIVAKKASTDAEETFLEHNNKVNETYGTSSSAKAHYVYFKLTFKAKMLDGGFYKDKNREIKESGLGPVVGWIAYDGDKKCAAPSTDTYNYRPKSPTSGFPKGSVYTYDAETGLCTVIFRPTIDTQTSNIYGAITIGNAEHGAVTSESKLLGENDFDASFIITEPELYAYDNDTKETYGDNLFRDADNKEVAFTSENINTDSTYRVDGPDYSSNDSILKVPSCGWYVDSGDSLIEKIKVPADYLSSKYDETNFVKHDETDYTREYYTNDNYPGLKFKKLDNGNEKAFAVIEDINKKMIILSANREGSPEGSIAPEYVNANRVANLICPININQYYRSIVFKKGTLAPSSPQYPPAGKAYFKVTMKAIRLEGDGAPMLGRLYGESNRAKASDNTSYSHNVTGGTTGDESGLPVNTYNPATGEFVGYARTYLNPGDEKTTKGHTEWLTIGNAERMGTVDKFWSTCFNSSFAITELKVDLYGASSNTIGDLIAEDIGPKLFEESIDTDTPRAYRVEGVSQDIYDITGASQKKWTVDGAVDLIHTYNLTTCVNEGHVDGFVENPITSTTLDNWYCPSCDAYYADNIGHEKIGTTAEVEAGNLLALNSKMVHIKGTGNTPAYLAIPLKVTGFRGHAYFKFSCLLKNLGSNDPVFRLYEARREGQKGGATPDSTLKPVYQGIDPYTMRLNVIFDVWRPAKSSYAPFFYAEPNTGGNFLLLIGNSELVGAGFKAVDADFTFADPQLVRVNGPTIDSSEMEGVPNVTMAPISDKTVTIDSPYHVGEYEKNWYYADEDSPLAAKLNRWYDIGGDIQLEDIPNKYFGIPQGITFDNTNAAVSSFQTIQSGKTYSFYYDGRIASDAVPKPFVEFISSNGTAKKEYLEYERDVDGKYSFKSTFTSPSGLRAERNVRIGIDIGDTEITGKVANFSLTEVSSGSDGNNLLVNGFLADTDDLIPYNENAEVGVWMYEGTLGNVVLESIPGSTFVIPTAYMATFAGTNSGSTEAKDTNDGRPNQGYIAQNVTVQKGQSYRVSYNVKYANKGYEEYGSKAGAEFTYVSTSGEKTLEVPLIESNEEYKEIYEFTVPDDIVETENNFKFTFNFWGAFVSGNVANFRMYKIVDGEDYGNNMFVEGTFPYGSYTNGWTLPSSGNYYLFQLAEVPENYFSKVTPFEPKMLHFQKTADWSWITSSPMLKPDTNYEWCFNRVLNKYDTDKKPTTPANTFIPSNTSMTDDMYTSIRSTETFETRKFKTDSNIRLYGNNNMILRYYMRQNSDGYYANLGLYELDDNGKRISGNLYLNGDFAAGYNGFEMSATDMKENAFEDIPEGFFDIPQSFEIQNMKGNISTFATVSGNKTYTFYYNGRFYSDAVAKPFVEFISSNGSVTRKYLEATKNSDMKYNFTANFTTPSGLRSSKNIRVGVDVDSKDIDGSVADFSLTLSGSTGRNLLKNGNFNDVTELVPYDDAVDEGIWMYEDDLGDSYIGNYIAVTYKQSNPNLLTFIGVNLNTSAAQSANNGAPVEGAIYQDFTVKKGSKYRVSFNVKFVNKGYAEYGSKAGAEFTYVTGSGTQTLSVPVVESEEEYRETYEFTAPDDIKETSKNLRFTFNVWGAFVSGHIADFTMYEIDGSGKPVGRNMFVEGDFPNGEYSAGWTKAGGFNVFTFNEIPDNFFNKVTPNEPRMLHFQKTADWSWITFNPMLKPNTNYEWSCNRIYESYDSDKVPSTTASMFKPSNTGMNTGDYTDIASGITFESKKFKTASTVRLYGANNMILRYYMRQNSVGYFANLGLYELDDDGNRISGNLFVNGDFALDYTCFEKSSTNMSSNTFDEIPEGFFDEPTEIQIKNAEGTVSTFATVSGKKTYVFYYDGKFESENVPKPFVEFISSDGNAKRRYLQYDRNVNGGYNFQAAFTTPSGLRSAKNIRIGIDIDSKDIEGSVANFSLTEVSGDDDGDNILVNGKMIEVKDLTPYSDSVDEGIWMYEGDMGDTVVGASIFDSYEQDVPIMIMFRGKNKNDAEATAANDGRPCEAKLSQKFTLTPGTKYRISYNVKYVSKGYAEYGSKAGAELLYSRPSDSSPTAVVPSTMTESKTEYRETYEFTMPDDAKEGANNFQFNFNYWGAFVSGYCANFTMYEVDAQGNNVGENKFVQGDFAGKTYYPGWDNSSYSNWATFQYVNIPDNFFMKDGSYKPKMLYFHSQADWAWFTLSPMVKPDTTYELSSNILITDEDKGKVSTRVNSMFYPNAEGVMTNTTMEADFYESITFENNVETKIFHTKPDVRLYGNNNMILRWYMREASAGYYGNIELYELDENGNRVGNNLFLNWDFPAEFKAFETFGVVDQWRFVEIPDGFFKTTNTTPSTMITSNGTASNANYVVNATVNRFKKQFLEFRYVGMNSAGVTPIVEYPAYDENGKIIYKQTKISNIYDSNRYYYEGTFTLPADAISNNGKTNIRILFNNGSKGKAYFTDIKLVEEGKYDNQITSVAADKSGNFQTVKYDPGVFVFYFDDTKFDDGDWSGERSANAYNIPTGNLTGTVMDDSFAPVSGARIRLEPGNITTTTDESGTYLFEGLQPGTYKLYLETAGVSLYCMDVPIEKGMTYNAPQITLNLNGDAVVDTDDIIATGGNGGAISGIYYGLDGKPKANVKIYITKSVYAVTDKDGRFEFSNIKPNTYALYVRVGNQFYKLRDVTVQAQKRISIKVQEPDLNGEDEELSFIEAIEEFFIDYPVYAALICAGIALFIGGIVFLIIFLATRKKRKEKKAAKVG